MINYLNIIFDILIDYIQYSLYIPRKYNKTRPCERNLLEGTSEAPQSSKPAAFSGLEQMTQTLLYKILTL